MAANVLLPRVLQCLTDLKAQIGRPLSGGLIRSAMSQNVRQTSLRHELHGEQYRPPSVLRGIHPHEMRVFQSRRNLSLLDQSLENLPTSRDCLVHYL